MKKTYSQKPAEVTREWHLINAKGKVLGRVAVEIAAKLIGKSKPTFTPHVDGGDYVVVINAAQVAVTGSKEDNKIYYKHSHRPGGLSQMTLREVREKHPERLIEKAVFNMLPKNKLRQGRMNRLKVYADDQHKHQSQLSPKDK